MKLLSRLTPQEANGLRTSLAIAFFLLASLPLSLSAATITARSCSTADVQAAINTAVTGDTVAVPAGTCAWTSGVTTANKAISVAGQGAGRIIAYTPDSLTVGTGVRTMTIQNAWSTTAITVGQTLRLSRMAARSNWMQGTVTSYANNVLTLNVTSSGGSGTGVRWLVSTIPVTTILNNATGNLFSLSEATNGHVRVSGIKVAAGTGDAVAFSIGYSQGGQAVVIRDCWVEQPNNFGGAVWSNTNRGVIAHSSFDSTPWASAPLAFHFQPNGLNTSWTTPSTMGAKDTTGENNFYLEDNDFHAYNNATDIDSNGRAVARYNIFNHAGFGTHGPDTSLQGQRHFEYYNNTGIFNGYSQTGVTFGLNWWLYIRGGTFVVANNVLPHITSQDYPNKPDLNVTVMNLQRNAGANPCWGDGTTNGALYPSPRQVGFGYVTGTGRDGKGRTQDSVLYVGDSEPIYIWGNRRPGGSAIALNVGMSDYGECTNPDETSNYVVAGRDYFNTAGTVKPGWTPYTYPHPLQSGTTPPQDTTAPTVPGSLNASSVSSTQINLSWTASTDNVGVTGYKIFRCAGATCTPTTEIASVTGTTYSNSGLTASTAYRYAVSAFDAAGNASATSTAAGATTAAPPVSGVPWAGIIDPSRAIDWAGAGVPGGIPNRSTVCATLNPGATATQINSAIQACPAGQVVRLNAGTYTLNAGLTLKSNVTLRGAGSNQTFLVFSGAGAGGYNSVISIEGSISANGYENNVCDWTAGYSKGSTVLTIGACSKGALTNLRVGSLLIVDQLDEEQDTGAIWNCATMGVCANTIQGGESRENGPCNGTMCLRSQQQGVIVTAINGSQITVSPGLYLPNWRTSQKPQGWFANTYITGAGIEDLSLDARVSGSNQSVMIANATNSWVKGVRGLWAQRSHVRFLLAAHSVLRDSYFYQNLSHESVSYGAEFMGAWDSIMENNIFQQTTDSAPSCSGACAGNYIGYNFDINNVWTQSSGWMQAGFYQHAAGDVYNLWEGNVGPGYNADQVHGTHHFNTLFRNYLIGNNQSLCGGAPCTQQTIPVHLYAGSRYFNLIGNVLGQAGYHTNYTCSATNTSSCSAGARSIYTLGFSGNSGNTDNDLDGFCSNATCASRSYFDPQVAAYLMRWGNYDTVTAAVRWNASEVPSSIGAFSNPVPATQSLPASFLYTAKPSWWPSTKAWPPIGPDVTGGTISGLSGKAHPLPAMDCYTNLMRGPADGTGNALPFDAAACYGTAAPDTRAPSAPRNLRLP